VLRLGLLAGLALRRGPKDDVSLMLVSGAGVARVTLLPGVLPGVLPGPDIVKGDEEVT